MAHYGGQSPPRVHRPRAPIMSAPPPLTAPLAPLRPLPPVSLAAPRPENERAANEYVETPFRVALALAAATTAPTRPPTPPPPPQPPRTTTTGTTLQRPTRLPLPTPSPTPPVTKQPAAATGVAVATFSKEPTGAQAAAAECASLRSIICPECSRCRCEVCQQPRPLPQRWVCNNGCLLSADTAIDYATCLCCVKGLFYHCSESDGGAGESCADDPCGCAPDRRKARWGCLAAISCALPCLLLYWPLRGCKRAAEACYARHARTGCRCRRHAPPPQQQHHQTPEKRLLDCESGPDF